MGGFVFSAPDLGNSTVGGNHQDRRHGGFERTVEPAEALHVEHVNLVDEKDPGHDRGLALLAPLGNFAVNLFADFVFDFSRVSGEEGLGGGGWGVGEG